MLQKSKRRNWNPNNIRQWEGNSIFPATSHDNEDVTPQKSTLQPKDPPFLYVLESRMWTSPRTSRFPPTHMAPPHRKSFLQPAMRSTASGPTTPSLRRLTQGQSKGRTANTARCPWKWTFLRKPRPCSRKSVTPPGSQDVWFKHRQRDP